MSDQIDYERLRERVEKAGMISRVKSLSTPQQQQAQTTRYRGRSRQPGHVQDRALAYAELAVRVNGAE
jgi:hypothetical protein